MRFTVKLLMAVSLAVSAGIVCVAREQQADENPSPQAPPAVQSQQAAEDPLAGLKKAGKEDLSRDKQITLDPEKVPVYTPEGKKVSGREFMEIFMSGGFVPEPYINENKEIKAFVLRASTEEEKKQILSMFQPKESEAGPVGSEAKPFDVTGLDGKKYSLKKLKGKIVVINFWFMECRPCRMEIPELNKVVDELRGRDIVFLGMATNSASQLSYFLEKNEFKYSVVPESGALAGTYGVTGFPTHVVIDRDSKIAYFSSGFGPGSVGRLKGEIEKLIKK